MTAAALVAHRMDFRSRQWWIAGHRSTEPAHGLALDRLDLEPLLDLRMHLGEASGALLALPLLRAAVATLVQMRTFEEAGVLRGSEPQADSDGHDEETSPFDEHPSGPDSASA